MANTKKQLRTKIIRKRDIYQLCYKSIGDTGWSQISLKTKDKAEAERKRQDFINNHVTDRRDRIALLEAQLLRLRGEEAESDLSIERVWIAFMESTKRKPISNETLSGYISYWSGEDGLKTFIGKQGIKSLADFSDEYAGQYVAALAKRRISKATAGKQITFFTRLWKVVAPDNDNPWFGQFPQGVGGKVKKRPFSLDQQRAIINSVEGEWKLLHLVMAYTGLRMVDACNLHGQHVDFDRGVIEVQPRRTRNRGNDPMTAKIGLHPTLGFMLRTALKGRTSGYFMPYLASEYDRDKSCISKCIQKQVKKATGLECNIKPDGRGRAVAVYGAHSHRKALSDRMREGGVDVMIRLQILGHKDSSGEAQTYSYISDKEVIAAIEKSMPDLLIRNQAMEKTG